MYSKNSKDPKAPAKSKRKQRGDKQEQAGGAQCTEAPVSCRGLGLSDFVVEGSQAGESQALFASACASSRGATRAGAPAASSQLWTNLIFLVFFQASAQMPTRSIYSDVTLPYLTKPPLVLCLSRQMPPRGIYSDVILPYLMSVKPNWWQRWIVWQAVSWFSSVRRGEMLESCARYSAHMLRY